MKCIVMGGKMGGGTFEFDPVPEEIEVPHYFPSRMIDRYRYVGSELVKIAGGKSMERAVFKFVGSRVPFIESYMPFA